MRTVNIGIVGCGRVGDYYLKILSSKKIQNFNLVSVADIDLKKTKKFENKFKCKAFISYKNKNFYKNIDAVLVLTPSGSHYEIAKFFLNKKKHVIAEKPLTMLPKNSLVLNKIAKKNKVICSVVFQNRFNTSIKFLKELIVKNKIGKIVSVSLSVLWCRYQNYYNDDWHGTWLNDGGVINQQALHHLDVIRYLFGPIKKVCAISGNRMNKLEAEDTMHALLEFKKGFNGNIEVTTAARPSDLHAAISVSGEKGNIVIGGVAINQIKKLQLRGLKELKNKIIIQKNSEKVTSGYGNSHIFYLNEIFKRISKKNYKPLVSCEEAYETSKLIHALYKSSENKKWINVNEKNLSNFLGRNR